MEVDSTDSYRESHRYTLLRGMYLANILVAAPIGLGTILLPGLTRSVLGIPVGLPIVNGIGTGAVPLAFGLAGIQGLRTPLRLSPVLALQALYKLLTLIGVILPLTISVGLPGHAVPIVVIFVFFAVGNLVAIPYDYLFFRRASK